MTTTADISKRQRKRRAAVLLLFVLFCLAFGSYIWLGGFKKPVMSEIKMPGYLLVGKEFRGQSNDQVLGAIFDQTKELNQKGQIPGTLAAIYYDVKDANKGKVHTFAGVLVKDSLPTLPPGYVYRSMPAGKAVQAEIFAHFLVAPAPGKVQQALAEFAKQNGYTPAKYVLEKYYGAKNIVLEIPVKE